LRTICAIFILTFIQSNTVFGQNNVTASISIPQNSGLAFVAYKTYEIKNDKLYVIMRSQINLFLDSTKQYDDKDLYDYDTIATYPVSIQNQIKLKDVIEKTDSFGHHFAFGCNIQMGWPRFFISASLDDKNLTGFIANCYRQHIFDIVDILNECYPEGNVLNYDKDELITREQECNDHDYGSNK
jgi:hypothetical protein